MRISHKRLTIWKTTFAVLLPIYGHKCWKKSSKIGRPDWTTSEPAMVVICQKSYLKYKNSFLFTLSSRPAASPLVKLVEREERWEAPGHPQGVSLQNWDGTKQNGTVTCMVLKAKANDNSKNLALRRDEFRGP
ncbi:zinc finger protein [Trichonephila clavipes]|nr:zinc finger protein [Trichonephila clavipes]